jgi:hypothetical protein
MSKASIIYFVGAAGRVKIGVTTNITKRLIALQIGSATKIELIATIPGDFKTEKALHARFSSARAHGEWFNLSREILSFLEEVKAGRFETWPVAGSAQASAPGNRLKATPAQFFDCVKVLFGAGWPSASAKEIGVSRQTIFNWKKDADRGICSISPAAVSAIHADGERKLALMREWIADLKIDVSTTGDTKPVTTASCHLTRIHI